MNAGYLLGLSTAFLLWVYYNYASAIIKIPFSKFDSFIFGSVSVFLLLLILISCLLGLIATFPRYDFRDE